MATRTPLAELGTIAVTDSVAAHMASYLAWTDQGAFEISCFAGILLGIVCHVTAIPRLPENHVPVGILRVRGQTEAERSQHARHAALAGPVRGVPPDRCGCRPKGRLHSVVP